VLCTEELHRRPLRPPNYETENGGLVSLAQALADSPATILQTLADTILAVLRCGSAGVSLLTEDGNRFHWPAIAGSWKSHIGGGTPRDFGPCGDVLDRDRPLLFGHLERRYAYFAPVTPAVEEALLVPFYLAGKAVGTIWAIAHDVSRAFDGEDLRMLKSLSTFASAAYHAVQQLNAHTELSHRHEQDRVRLRDTNEALLLSSVRLQELADGSEAVSVRLQEAVKEKEYYIAVLSHELRAPLTPVLIAASMLQQNQELEPETRETMAMIHRNVTLEARLIDDLLDMTRMERGKLHLDRRPIELGSVLERAVEECRDDLGEAGLTLAVETAGKTQIVEADAGRIQQVFANLLKNAIKFTPAGGRIHILSHCDGDSCVVEVSDSGIGLNSDFLPRAFSAFEQGDKAHAREAGLGLGLAICKTIMDLHGGTITAHSEGKGRGATFVVKLPTMTGVQSPAAAKEPAAPAAPRPAKPLRILLVEDHADTARAMRQLLKADGHAVQIAGDVAAALKLAAAEEFDLLLSDLGLPDGTGVELMHALRRKGSTLPGIVLSGYGQDQDIAQSREAGFATHLVKPLRSEQIRHAIVTLVG
jgi:signal transduction histidine kinase